MAEDFGAQPNSPQIACLQELRSSDAVVLILGESYGFVPPGSSLSATHQEYREARGRKPVLAFVQQGMAPEPEQAAFIEEVQGWESGLFRGSFSNSDDLQDGITRALHDLTLTNAVAPVNEQDLRGRALELLPKQNRNQLSSTFLDIALGGGPTQRILRPAELESASLAEHLQQAAMFGAHRVFDRSKGSQGGIYDADLIIRQERGGSIRLTEEGSLALRLPLDKAPSEGRFDAASAVMVIIEEDVQQRIATGLGFAAEVIEHIDPTQRLSHFAIAAGLVGADYRAWRTQAKHAISPSSVQIGVNAGANQAPVTVSVRRAAFRLDRTNLVEDILVPLRRQFPQG